MKTQKSIYQILVDKSSSKLGSKKASLSKVFFVQIIVE
jgi:hypothetical protein